MCPCHVVVGPSVQVPPSPRPLCYSGNGSTASGAVLNERFLAIVLVKFALCQRSQP